MSQKVRIFDMDNAVFPEVLSDVKEEFVDDDSYLDDKVFVGETTINIGTTKLKEYVSDDETKLGQVSPNIKLELPADTDSCNMIKDKFKKQSGDIRVEFNYKQLFCNNCNEYYEEYCTKCGMLISILNKKSNPKEIPKDILELRDGLFRDAGVFALKIIPKGVKFGPYSGLGTPKPFWKLKRGKLEADNSKSEFSNWMQFINSTRSVSEQNLYAFQYEDNLYYRSTREIHKGEELLVYFGAEYEESLSKDMEIDFAPIIEKDIPKVFACTFCCLGFSLETYLYQHKTICFRTSGNFEASIHRDYICEVCEEPLGSCIHAERAAKRRLSPEVQPSTSEYRCCNLVFSNVLKYRGHLGSQQHFSNKSRPLEEGVFEITTSFKNRVASYKILGNQNSDIAIFLAESELKACQLIRNVLMRTVSVIKVQLELFVYFVKPHDDGQISKLESFTTQYIVLTESSGLEDIFNQLAAIIQKKSKTFQKRDISWTFKSTSHLEVNINTHQPLKSCSFLELPAPIKYKKACINIRNNDNACLAWCLTAALHPVNIRVNRPTSYPHYSTVLILENVNFPVKLHDLSEIEKMNNLSINVYTYTLDSDKRNFDLVGPIYFTQNRKDVHVNLLLVVEGSKFHYVLIKNLSRLFYYSVNKQVTSV